MRSDQITPHHLLCFVCIGFANLSSPNMSKKTYDEIESKIASWINVNPSNIVKFTNLINDTIIWYDSIKTSEKRNYVLKIAKSINTKGIITLERKKSFLSDIRDIAVADGVFNSEEKNLHDRIAKELGINIMTTDKVIRKKIGY